MSKRANGVYYTQGNPFQTRAFTAWAKQVGLPQAKIVEPFAGANSLIDMLEAMGLCRHVQSFDIAPGKRKVQQRDTLACFPTGYDVCITNPPWLAKNSATRRGLPFPSTRYDDLYKYALEKCLDNCGYVAALVPESFIRARLFQERLGDFISLTGRMFTDTDNPVGLALFTDRTSRDVRVWRDSKYLGTLSTLESRLPALPVGKDAIYFNDPNGNVGLIAIDNTREASIRFCTPKELGDYVVRGSCRSITKLRVEGAVRIDDWNACLAEFRHKTHDVLMTAFKGLRKDGYYRRRLDWGLARRVISYA